MKEFLWKMYIFAVYSNFEDIFSDIQRMFFLNVFLKKGVGCRYCLSDIL